MRSILLFAFLLLSQFALAQLRLPVIFSSGMVLQQEKPIRVWGWADAQQLVTVAFKGKKYKAFADRNGEWQLFLDPAKAGSAGELSVSAGDQRIELTNILVGEVWICSGQSNMEWTMGMLGDTYRQEMDTAHNDNIRFVTLRKAISNTPLQDVVLDNNWSPIDTATIADCSAIAYWFAKALNRKLQVPVGLVITSWGGTPAQAWTSFEGLHDFPGYSSTFIQKIQPFPLDRLEERQRTLDARFREKIREKSAFLEKATRPGFDDDKWEDMYLPREWEEQGYPNLDGFAVYRIVFKVDKADAGREAVLHLPPVDDMDSTYLNGIFLGSTYQWDALRTYNIPAGVLKSGRNVLVIKVQDDRGGGGLSPREDIFNVVVNQKTIPLAGLAKFKIIAVLEDLTGGRGAIEHQPAVIYNAMIAPLLPMAMRGVIWYQGESNAGQPLEYRSLFPALITDWRNRWGQGDFPFLFAQISSFGPILPEPFDSDWAALRESQTMTLALPNTAMAVTTDVGNPSDIHPHQKKEVSDRLADGAMRIAYGRPELIAEGPRYKRCTFEGPQAMVEFSGVGTGLMVKGAQLKAFAIAGEDKKFVWADARIEGDRVVVSSPLVEKAVALRYAWADSPIDANLYNREGFPAIPFRTDFIPLPNPVIAHRGAWKQRGLPENSLASLRAAIEMGCAGSEFDVRLSADDSLVINHDPDYHSLPIEKTRYATLAAYPLSNGEKLPTLREYLLAGMARNTETKLICEIKASGTSKERSREIARKTVALVNELNAQDRVVYISFDYDILLEIRRLYPDAITQYLEGDHSPEQLKADGISGADYHFSVYHEHPDWAAIALKNNLQLNAWTVNETAEMEWLMARGVQFITTNEPELLLDLIRKKTENGQ